jgi:hypothetical protein
MIYDMIRLVKLKFIKLKNNFVIESHAIFILEYFHFHNI